MEVKAGYKQTAVGVIPVDWEATAIGSAIDLLTGYPFPSLGYTEFGVRLLRGSNVKRGATDWNDSITQYWPAVTPELARYALRPGDLIIAMDGSLVGRSYAQLTSKDLPALLLQRVARIRSTQLDVSYLAAFVGSERFIKYADSVKTVTAIPHISPGDIKKFTIPLPPTLPEQRAIAAALSDVDALLGGLERLIAKKRDLKRAAMQQLLTGQTRLPGFHGEWEVKRLGELGIWKGGMTPSMQNPAYWQNGDIPWISSGDVKSVLLTRTGFSITSAAVRQGTTTLVPAGSVIVVTRSGILRKYLPVAMNIVPMAINQDIKALIPASEFCPAFVLHTLIGHGDRILARCMKAGTTVESIEFRWLKAFAAPMPPNVAEQTAIAAVLSDMDAELSALEARRDKTRALKQAMMQELLTGRTRLV